jgi:hypothetical protein
MCLGDVLTKMEVFLFMTSLIQTYELCVPSSADELTLPIGDLSGTAAVSVVPKPFQVSLKLRGNNNKRSA